MQHAPTVVIISIYNIILRPLLTSLLSCQPYVPLDDVLCAVAFHNPAAPPQTKIQIRERGRAAAARVAAPPPAHMYTYTHIHIHSRQVF